MENLSEEQREQIIRKRQEMLKKMGVPKAGQMVNESVVAGAANSSMAAKLAAIKKGAAKADFNKHISATSKSSSNGPGMEGFQGIPEPKMKKGPKGQNEEVKPEYKQKLEDFGGPAVANNHELASIDALFGGDGGHSRGAATATQHPINNEISMDYGGMPTFNPNAFKQKMQAKAAQTNSEPNPYLQYANEGSMQMEQFETVQPQFNMQNLQIMMEKIARGVAEKTIKNVLSEYSEQQKSKLQFEWYNKDKQVIKMADGKLYQLTPVQIRKKTS